MIKVYRVFMDFLKRIFQLNPATASGNLYGHLYDHLIEFHERQGLSKEEALKEAIGGDYETYGRIERDALLTLGYSGEGTLVDLGCGSGRLVRKLAPFIKDQGKYLGLDVNQSLIDEARDQVTRTGGRECIRFETVLEPILPCEKRSVDFLVAFSVVTHIDIEDTFNYLLEVERILKPSGRALISYLSTEIEGHWNLFLQEAKLRVDERNSRVRNHVMVPGTLNRLAEKAGLCIKEDFPADYPWIELSEPVEMDARMRERGEKIHLGQSSLILQIPS